MTNYLFIYLLGFSNLQTYAFTLIQKMDRNNFSKTFQEIFLFEKLYYCIVDFIEERDSSHALIVAFEMSQKRNKAMDSKNCCRRSGSSTDVER